jgi:hypothetical protein
MEAAILVFGIIAAVAAVAAVIVPLWRQRERLELAWGGGFGSSGTEITLPARVENRGRSPIYNVSLYAGPPGITLGNRDPIDIVTLQPGGHYGFFAHVGRGPDGAELGPGETRPTLKIPLLIIASRGRRLTVSEMPAGPFSSDRATTKTQTLRRPI